MYMCKVPAVQQAYGAHYPEVHMQTCICGINGVYGQEAAGQLARATFARKFCR